MTSTKWFGGLRMGHRRAVATAALLICSALVVGVKAVQGQLPADPQEALTAPLEQTMPVEPSVIIDRLDNGLSYYIRENARPEKRAELRLVLKVGSLVEDEDQLGLAHFAEHMAFNGTRNFVKQDLVKVLESFGMRFGADINASTSFDETIYMLRIPTDAPEIVATAFRVLEDWATGVTFEASEVEKERGVVIEEWRLGLGAQSRLRDQQFPILFRGSRYAERLPIGDPTVLESFEPEILKRFYRDWYRPDLMAVIAVGDFNKMEIEGLIRQHFAGIPLPSDPRPRPAYGVPDHEETLFAFASDPEATGLSVTVYHKLPVRPQGTIGAYRQSLVEGLYNRLFNRRLAERAQQRDPPFLGASSGQGLFVPSKEVYVLGAGVPEGGIERGLEALFIEAERVARFGFTESELERVKRLVLRGFERVHTEMEIQPSPPFADEFTRAFLEGESVPGIAYEWGLHQRFIPEIIVEEVNRVGRNWIADHNRVILVTSPDKEGLRLPSEETLLSVLERVTLRPIARYRDTVTEAPLMAEIPAAVDIVESRTIDEIGVTEWRLANGVRVVLKPTDFREDQVLLRAFSPGGTSLASDEDYVAAISAVQVVAAGGFAGLSAREITNMLAGKVVDVRPTIDSFEEGLVGSASPQDLETLFQLIYVTFTSPRADPGVFDLMQQQIRASLVNREVSPEVAFYEELETTLTQNHHRRRPISLDLVNEMDLSASYAFYKDRFADASDFTFVFAGNLEPETIQPLVQRYLGSLPSTGRQETWRDEGVDPPEGTVRRIVYKGVEPKSLTSIVFTGQFEGPESRDWNAVGVMTAVLQTRLREELREELGGTYSVQIEESLSRIPDAEYAVTITFGSAPERVQELSRVVFDEIEALQQDGPTDQELANVLESRRRQFEIAVRRNGFWLGRLVSAYRNGDDSLDVFGDEESLQKLEASVVQDMARLYLNLENYVHVSLYPER